MINQILQTPRGAVQGGTGQSNATQGTTIGGGIAGIASTLERTGIKVYNDMTKYNEWEFVYDISKDQSRAGGGVPGQQGQQGQQPGNAQPGALQPGNLQPGMQPLSPQQLTPPPPIPSK